MAEVFDLKKHTNLNVCISKNRFFLQYRKKELIEQNDGYFWIQRAKITVEKLLSTLQQSGC